MIFVHFCCHCQYCKWSVPYVRSWCKCCIMLSASQQHSFTGDLMRCRWRKSYSGGRRQPRSVLLPKRHCSGHSYVPKAQERSAQTLEVSCSCLTNITCSICLTLSLQACCRYSLHASVTLHLSAAQSDPDQTAKEKLLSLWSFK